MDIIKKDLNVQWMRHRHLFAVISCVLLLVTPALLIWPGAVLSTDFRGGTEVEIEFKKPVEVGQVRQALARGGFEAAEVVRSQAGPSRYIVRTSLTSALTDDTKAAVETAFCVGAPEQESCGGLRPTELKLSPAGDRVTLRYDVKPDVAAIRERLAAVPGLPLRTGEGAIELRSGRGFKVEAQLRNMGDKLMQELQAELGADVVPDAALRTDWVGAKAGSDLRRAALVSITLALIGIMLYIAFRFDMRFAPGSAVAVTHDAIITFGVLLALRMELNLSTVAAMLTVVGYSTNDKVVVYDRIRENMGKHRAMGFEALIDKSLNEVLRRTLITGIPTMMSLFAFVFLGTGLLKNFALTMVVGVLVGTYSSYYVAVPLTWWLDKRFFRQSSTKPVSRERRPVRDSAVV